MQRASARKAVAHGAHQTADVVPAITERAPETHVAEDAGDHPGEAVASRVVGPKDRDLGLEVLGRDHRPDEDVAVVVITPIEEPAEHRVVIGLGQLRLVVQRQEAHVLDLDPAPQDVGRVAQMKLAAQQGDRLADPLVVVADPLARRSLHRRPIRRLEAFASPAGDLAEQPIVTPESVEDRLGNLFCLGPCHGLASLPLSGSIAALWNPD
jgi:hypothetical protein